MNQERNNEKKNRKNCLETGLLVLIFFYHYTHIIKTIFKEFRVAQHPDDVEECKHGALWSIIHPKPVFENTHNKLTSQSAWTQQWKQITCIWRWCVRLWKSTWESKGWLRHRIRNEKRKDESQVLKPLDTLCVDYRGMRRVKIWCPGLLIPVLFASMVGKWKSLLSNFEIKETQACLPAHRRKTAWKDKLHQMTTVFFTHIFFLNI